MTLRVRFVLSIAGALAVSVASLNAQGVPSGADGRDLYMEHCASCHGPTAEGNGPVASMLRKKPANLTFYSMTNGGVFPAVKLRRIIDGREVVAHGVPEMPVWGNVFRTSGAGLDATGVRARIDAIVGYIESIQMRRGH